MFIHSQVICQYCWQDIPQPTPIQTKMPPELFGEAVMALEFLHSFAELFDKDDQFPGTFTLGTLLTRVFAP